ncbi:MAG: Mur ligase family protein, partial [Candidatus Omnitrophica bacterium]|nr:Mur ligase family protein [Candidatus Omnitrophota bacterium]
YNTVSSPRSYNSQVGVPLSVLMAEPDAEVYLFEAGISYPGEMERLERIIRPRTGIITNIGEAHQENFSDIRQVRIFHLKYAIPEQAFNMLDTIKSEIGKVLLDVDSGTVLVMDTPQKIKEMEKALSAMEQKSIVKIFNLKYARAKDIEEQLKTQLDLKKVGSIKADDRTNQVIVQTLPERMEEIGRLIEGLDRKTKEILIDAKIIQVKLNDSLSSGVEWEGLFDIGKKYGLMYMGSYPFSAVQASTDAWRSRKEVLEGTPKQAISGSIITDYTTPGVGYVGSYPFTGTSTKYSEGKVSVGTEEMHLGIIGRHDFDTIIKYLQSLGQTRILSNPKLAVVNNQEAKIHVGERQAYITTTTTQTQSSTTVSEAVTYVDVGIQLFVTPNINDEGFVTLKIKPEISNVVSYLETSSNNKIPIIDTSTAETIVMVKDGSTILIGGLSKEEKIVSSEGTPFLSKIPILGEAFRSRSTRTSRTELVVLLTPHIISGDELTTGYARDFGYLLDKEYQGYGSFSEEKPTWEYKTYQSYPKLNEPEKLPEMKPARNF